MKRPSIARIAKFKELLLVTGDSLARDGDAEMKETAKMCYQLGGALCWAMGCGCEAAERFETLVLSLGETWEGNVIDKKGRKVDVLKALATGKDR